MGDEVIEVNNINVEGKTPGEVLSILVNIINVSFICAASFIMEFLCLFLAK